MTEGLSMEEPAKLEAYLRSLYDQIFLLEEDVHQERRQRADFAKKLMSEKEFHAETRKRLDSACRLLYSNKKAWVAEIQRLRHEKRNLRQENRRLRKSMAGPRQRALARGSLASDSAGPSSSYSMAPSRHAGNLPPEPLENENNYGLDHLDSEGSTDDEEEPIKEVPKWAEGSLLRTALLKQLYMGPDLDAIFAPIEMPELANMFDHQRKRFFKRTSPIVPTCDNRVAGFIAAFSAGLRAGFYFLHNCARAAAFIVTSRTCLCSYTGDKVPQDFWKDLPHHFSYFFRKSIQEGRHTSVR